MPSRTVAGALLFVAACAGNGSPVPPPQPVNGLCAVIQDTCRASTPTGIGDTTAPYYWTCAGSYGGRTEACSLPTATVGNGEIFTGQTEVVERERGR